MSFKKLEAYLNSLNSEHGIPAGDCIVIQNNETVFRHTFGYSDSGFAQPAGKDDLYFFYSASKPITCAAAMKLVESGKMFLDDKLEKYLPEFSNMLVFDKTPELPVFSLPVNEKLRKAENSIRIIDLMTMTSGLSYDLNNAALKGYIKSKPEASTRDVVYQLAKLPLVFEPGSRWLYGLSHDVLGAVIELASGMGLEEYVRKNIFEPLDIKDIYVRVPEGEKYRISALYALNQDGRSLKEMEKANSFLLTENYVGGGAPFAGSVDEYAKFAAAMSNGGIGLNGNRILSRESIDAMRKNRLSGQPLKDFEGGGKKGYGYGLGVRSLIDAAASPSPIGEFGWDGAAGAYVLIDPDNRLSIFYAQHVWFCMDAYEKYHPQIRNLCYEALGIVK